MSDSVVKRLHIGGLTPSITPAHIKDRFSSFGTVKDVEELKPDALGQPRPFTFFTIQTTPAQLKKCLNIMSGSHWRGAQLRLAEAKLRYDVSVSSLSQPTPEQKAREIEKKRKRGLSSRAEGVGKEAQDGRLVTEQIAEKKKFWVVNDAQGGRRLIRPMAMRPSHPIGSAQRENQSKIKSKGKDGKRPARLPPKRASNKVINPIAYGSSYVTENELGGADQVELALEDEWEYEELDVDVMGEGEAEDGRVAVGIWRRRKDGQLIEEQVVRSKRRRVDLDNIDAGAVSESEDGHESDDQLGAEGEDSPLFASRGLPEQRERNASPLFPSRNQDRALSEHGSEESPTSQTGANTVEGVHQDDISSYDARSPLFPVRTVSLEAGPSSQSSKTTQASRSPSPLFPTHTAPVRQTSRPSAPSPGASPPRPRQMPNRGPAVPAPLRDIALAERSQALGVLGNLLGGLSPPPVRVGKSEWAGYSESDDEDDVKYGRTLHSENEEIPAAVVFEQGAVLEVREKPLRLRGGAASSSASDSSDSGSSSETNSEEEESSEGGDSSDDSQSDSESDSDESSENDSDTNSESDDSSTSDESSSTTSTPMTAAPPPKSSLKDMFAPSTSTSISVPASGSTSAGKQSQGFSLLANLDVDIELDEDMDIPIPSTSAGVGAGDAEGVSKVEPLELLFSSSSRNRVKLEHDPETPLPLFFPIPIAGASTGALSQTPGGKKGESINPMIELYVAQPPPPSFQSRATATPGAAAATAVAVSRGYGSRYGEEQRVEVEKRVLPGFFRQAGETDEMMKAKWEESKVELTQEWKKRFREARKSRKRRGGEEIE